MIKVHILQTGRVYVDVGVPLKQKNPLAITGLFRSEEKRIWLPVSVYLIEHPKGKILIDTGWDKKQRDKKIKKHCGFLPISYGDLPANMAVDEQLARLGYQPSNIDYVFLSHMDGDHVGGLQLVAQAKKIMIAKEEWLATKKKKNFYRYHAEFWKDIKIDTFDYEDTGVGPFQRSYDVFGDGSVQLVDTKGHSAGLFTTLIQGENSFVALVSDTGYMRESWETLHIPGLTIDKRIALESLKWVKRLSQLPNCSGIYANHDPEISPMTFTL